MTATRQFCTFYLAQSLFGVEVEKVQEVIRHQEMTQVPLADPVVGGLINLRGQIVTALDMRQRLGLSKRGPEQMPMNVVVRGDDGAVSLLVDEIGDVVEVDESEFEPPPDTLSGPSREMILGAFKLKGRLLLLLDTERAMRLA